MFERYTERARRVIFFARYEATNYGSEKIATEHILLGLLREDKNLTSRFFSPRSQFNVETIRREIEGRSVLREKLPQTQELILTAESKRILIHAFEESERLQIRSIGPEHLLLGLLREERSMGAEILYERGLRLNAVREELMRQNGFEKTSRQETQHLQEFTKDLTELAYQDKLDPLIGRTTEIDRLTEILCRRTKNNPLLIGEAGVGKTAIVEGLANRIVNGDVPSFLEQKRILSLDLSLVVAGTKYRGQFEERLKNILRELRENPNFIVFVDEVHTLVGAGNAEGTLDAANILKPALSRGEIQLIGATTPKEFRKTIERDRALERRFQMIKVAPPNETEALHIIKGIREKYESFHGVRYSDEALKAAVTQSNRYLPERFLPDKAIDVIDEAGSRVKLRDFKTDDYAETSWQKTIKDWTRSTSNDEAFYNSNPDENTDLSSLLEVTKRDIEEVIAHWTGIPLTSVAEGEAGKLLRIEDELKSRIVSQRPAISALARAIRRSRAGLKSAKRPVGSFLFLGATGVGKTEVARALAEFLFESERALIRFDMSEFMEKHTVAKLIGAPPGYVGYDNGGQLTEKLRRQPYAVVLFDEVEKAHPDLFNVLLQVFEDGILTDSQGVTVDCKNAIFIMTSNIGARFIQKKTALGFQVNGEKSREQLEEKVLSEVRQTFAPEFINRLDEIIIFDELTETDLLEIVGLQVEDVNRTLTERELRINLTDDAKSWIVAKTCNDRSYGARPLRRALQKYVEDALADSLLDGSLSEAKTVEVYPSKDSDKLEFRITGKTSAVDELRELEKLDQEFFDFESLDKFSK
ncbi:MAG: ATP-dependent Clp protease ATP-binding subunit [Pyrinomonadaceae bacterium]|nr:ATP-dependent Clp protease ATP-binding subunit [Pyrinomonadaceae bacterium]